MSEGFIDSASTYEIVKFMSYYNLKEECTPWTGCSAIEVTCSLINTESLKLSPAPTISKSASGPYEHLMLKLASSNVISNKQRNPEIEKPALKRTKNWARNSHALILNIYKKMKEDKINFQKWLDWAITYAWIEHTTRLQGLFNPEFIPQFSKILNIPIDILKEIYKLSCNQKVVNDFVKNKPDNDDFRIMQDAYVLAALLRGRYHDYVAKDANLQIMHHPIRTPILTNLSNNLKTEFLISNVEEYLSIIILAGSFAERNQFEKLSCWALNVEKARKAANLGIIDLRPKDYDKIALDSAINIAKQIDIRTHAKWIDNLLDTIYALGIGILTSFVLKNWSALSLSSGAYAISRDKSLGEKTGKFIFESKSHLCDLAKSNPGRIEKNWKE